MIQNHVSDEEKQVYILFSVMYRYTVAEVKPEASKHTVKNLTEGEDYNFRISAENAIGRSKPVELDSVVKPSRPIGNSSNFFKIHLFLEVLCQSF